MREYFKSSIFKQRKCNASPDETDRRRQSGKGKVLGPEMLFGSVDGIQRRCGEDCKSGSYWKSMVPPGRHSPRSILLFKKTL